MKVELANLIEPTIEQLGYELSDLELKLGGRDGIVRVFIELDRKLTKPAHFQRFAGETVRVKLRFPVAGRRNFRGTLLSADDEKIEVEVDGESHSLQIATIESARLIPAL
jgi:ribosome maturation factor RimP